MLFLCVCLLVARPGFAQIDTQSNFQSHNVHVLTLTDLIVDQDDLQISLWGVETIQGHAEVIQFKGRMALEAKIGGEPIFCMSEGQSDRTFVAQCFNATQEDLSLFLLEEGYVSTDRLAVRDTEYEAIYLDAERRAHNVGKGIWGQDISSASAQQDYKTKRLIFVFLGILVLFMVGLGVLIFSMIAGFRRVLELQNRSLNLAGKERKLRDKEKMITAALIHAEIQDNKEKIEAYLMIHEDVLLNLKSSNHQIMRDIIQIQPALGRAVFDGNTSKLELFGSTLASEIIHYYARIKTHPDFVEFTSDTDISEMIKTVESAVEQVRKLRSISEDLIEDFINHALIKSAP